MSVEKASLRTPEVALENPEEWRVFVSQNGAVQENVLIHDDGTVILCRICGLDLDYPTTADGKNASTAMNGHLTGHKRRARKQAEKAATTAELQQVIEGTDDQYLELAEKYDRIRDLTSEYLRLQIRVIELTAQLAVAQENLEAAGTALTALVED